MMSGVLTSSCIDQQFLSCINATKYYQYELCQTCTPREMTQQREMTPPRTTLVLQLPAPQVVPRAKVVPESCQFSASSSTDTPRTKVVLQSRQFSSSSSPDTPRTKVVLQSRQFSASSSQIAPRTKVVLESRQFSASSSTDCSAY